MRKNTIFMPATEVATCLDITSARVYQLVAAGLLPAVKRGRRTLIPRLAFDAYVEDLNRQALQNLTGVVPQATHELEADTEEPMLRGLKSPQEAANE